jgi:GTP:adenosylcobinamide-phosphate guanylyltransferase
VARSPVVSAFSALVLAGSRPGGDPLALHTGVSAKALIDIGGVPMLSRVVAALKDAGASPIAVAASDPDVIALARSLGCGIVLAEAGPSDSAAAGFRALGAPMLLTTADHALLQPEWITHFLAAQQPDTDVSALLARRDTIEQAVPQTRRTYLTFADGAWSGCNLFYLATPAAAAALQLWHLVEADRKRPWRIVAKLGPFLLLRYLLGRLTLQDAFTHLGMRANLKAQAIESPFGLAAVDVDKPDDLDLVRKLVG